MSKLSGRELYISTTTAYIHGKIMLSGRGYIEPPHVLKLSGGGFISTTTTYIHGKIMLSRRGYIDPPSC